MIKRLVALPFLAFALVAAKDAPPPPKPPVSLIAPAEVAADLANRWTLELSNGGKVVIQLRPDVAPQHVYRIQQLTTAGFYDGLIFHRVIPGFMAQGGDPMGTGEGGSKLPDLPAEFNDLPHVRGVASMARAQEPNTGNSQFFIMLAPRFALDHKYSAFGRVIEGMATVDVIAVGEPPAQPTKIVRATIGGPLPAPPVVAVAPVPAQPEVAADSAAPAPAAAVAAEGPAAAPAADAVAPALAAESPSPAPAETAAAPAPAPEAAAPAPEAEKQEAPQPQ
jgi:peptidylprolyl isomerase